MLEHETLHRNDWLSLKICRDPEQGVHGYVYSHEERCGGSIVAVLPYAFDAKDGPILLLRDEVTPCWGMDSVLSSLTGGLEADETPYTMAAIELREEAGYSDVPDERWEYLGWSRASKSSDTTYHLFAVDVTGLEPGEATGDGSELEAKASMCWKTPKAAIWSSPDPQLAVLWGRLWSRQEWVR